MTKPMSAAAKNSMAAPTGYVGLHGEMRRFYLAYPRPGISQTASGKLELSEVAQAFSLHWSAYARLLLVKDEPARRFYEAEALRGGWSVRQLDRQVSSQFYERTALSILCADKGHAMARYALEGLPSKVMAANYRPLLPDAELLQKELESIRRRFVSGGTNVPKRSAKLSKS